MTKKILHIGGADSPHVVGLMEHAKDAGFQQVLLSYPANIRQFNQDFFKDIKQYYYKYQIFFTNKVVANIQEKEMAAFVLNIIKREKPDLIHGHYLSKCAVPMYYAQAYSKKPGIVVPWSKWDIAGRKSTMFLRIKRCLNLCSYVMGTHTGFINELLDNYAQPRRKRLFCGPAIRLYLYKGHVPDVSEPRVFVPRGYYPDEVYGAIANVFKVYPNLKVTALARPATHALIKKLGVHEKINFLPGMLSQVDFSDMMKKHNIVFSVAPDGGNGGTMTQAAYSGAITITNKTKWNGGYFEHNKNTVFCKAISVNDLTDSLLYSINNLKTLCGRFVVNNKFLEKFDARITGKNLIDAYNRLLK